MRNLEKFLFWSVRLSAIFMPFITIAGILQGGAFAFAGFLVVFGYYFLVELVLWSTGLGVTTTEYTEFRHVNPSIPNWSDLYGVGIYGLLQVLLLPTAILWMAVHTQDALTIVGGILSLATMAGSVGGLAGHEYIHRKSRWEKSLGVLIFGVVNYAHFAVSHLRGHHVAVALENDWSTSRKGESAFAFLWRAQVHGYFGAWSLEAERLVRLKKRVVSLQNFMIRFTLVQLLFIGAVAKVFGFKAVALYLVTSVVATSLMEMVNYLSHYGLRRQLGANGIPERVKNIHSWESNNKVTNWFIFNAGKHCHHHKNSYEPHHQLILANESPYLPYGLPLMTLIAFLPPLYFRLMNPMLEQNAGREDVNQEFVLQTLPTGTDL